MEYSEVYNIIRDIDTTINGCNCNITTNSGELNDRILHLQAGKIEQFNIILTNLNKIDVKYEFTYDE